MSSTALTLVNKILRLTGDYKDVTTLANSPNGIAYRILEYINMTIADIDSSTNWPRLRVNAVGTTDGLTDVLDFVGTENADSGGLVSVWVDNVGSLEEATADQFDTFLATPTGTTNINPQAAVTHFQRGVTLSGAIQIQLYPFPVAGLVVHTTAYQKASLLSIEIDTTQFDDDLLILGAMMHMERFQDIDQGSATLYQQALQKRIESTFSNMKIRTQVERY